MRNPALQNVEKYEPTQAQMLEGFLSQVLSVTSQHRNQILSQVRKNP